jgi:CspA family cold shock protein
MPVGKVISLSQEKGFGFIQATGGGDDLFFHHSAVDGEFDSLHVGDQVRYDVDATAEKPRAQVVTPLRAGDRGAAPRRKPPRAVKGSTERSCAADFFTDAELGFVTRLRRKERLGFISADRGGPELLFGAENVSGTRSFGKLTVGDSVRFVRDTDKDADPPLAIAVQYTERRQQKSDLGLPTNPRARRKKPTWRR